MKLYNKQTETGSNLVDLANLLIKYKEDLKLKPSKINKKGKYYMVLDKYGNEIFL
jgi:hypothetical protein